MILVSMPAKYRTKSGLEGNCRFVMFGFLGAVGRAGEFRPLGALLP